MSPAQLSLVSDSRKPSTLAPMLRHYLELKRDYQDFLLLYQVGDFYEVFFEDAEVASQVLGIRLTSRHKDQPDPVPMCGVPIHALDNYLPKLISSGHRCVVVSQVEDAGVTKGTLRREVTRVITAGVRFAGDGIDEQSANYIASICLRGGEVGGIAYADVSTAKFVMREVDTLREALQFLEQISPAEVLLPTSVDGIRLNLEESWLRATSKLINKIEAQRVRRPFERKVTEALSSQLEASSAGELEVLSKLDSISPELRSAALALLSYVQEISFSSKLTFAEVRLQESSQALVLDAASVRNLELFSSSVRANPKHSLCHQVDYTRTPMGARLLRDWLRMPSTNQVEIEQRLEAVSQMKGESSILGQVRERLSAVRDLDRLTSRVNTGRATPRDLASLRDSIGEMPSIFRGLEGFDCELFRQSQFAKADLLEDLLILLEKNLADEPSNKLGEGVVIRPGADQEIDRLRELRSDGSAWLKNFEEQQRRRTGISSLKVKKNNVFGYYIEVTKAHLNRVPEDYQRRQTLVNAERFITPELKEFEESINSSQFKLEKRERELFEALRDSTANAASRIFSLSLAIAKIDLLAGFAELARQRNLIRPLISDGSRLETEGGRHLVVEAVVGEQAFVPNDTKLVRGERQFAILTGPNMGGKSTYLRQVAQIQLLAQIGSFVPARKALLPIVDRIFTRIGASDDVAAGESTFMVEMREVSSIVRSATPSSLVLIDEVGRGTATADGYAIARALVEWLSQRTKCFTVFATHFHELTELADSEQALFCLAVGAKKVGETLEFTHRIEERCGDRSYGVEVARLAGLPRALLDRANSILAQELEEFSRASDCSRETETVAAQLSESEEQVLSKLRGLNLNKLTPIEALNLLDLLKGELDE